MKVPRRTFDRTHLWQTWHAGIQDSGLNIWGFLPSLVEKPYIQCGSFRFQRATDILQGHRCIAYGCPKASTLG